MQKTVLTTFKFLFSGAIIYWFLSSGKLDLKLALDLFSSPSRFITGLTLVVLVLFLGAYRYLWIIRIKSQSIGFKSILKYNWIAQFFNAVLPGSVTGDLIKVFYLNKMDQKLSKSFLLGSILIDRIAGLLGLVVSLGFFSLWNYTRLVNISSQVGLLLNINLVLLLIVFCFLVILLFFEDLPKILLKYLESISLISGIVQKFQSLWLVVIQFQKSLLWMLLISIVIQALSVFIFWFVTEPYSQGPFDLFTAFSVIPLGFIALVIPLSPSGLGVGHAVFHSLFLLMNVQNGASLFNIFFLLGLMVNLLGIIPYLGLKKNSDVIR